MLQPAAAPLGQVQDEQIGVVGQPAEDVARGLDDGLCVGPQPLRVFVAMPPDGDAVRNAIDFKAQQPVVADLDRAVDQMIVVIGAESVAQAPVDSGRGPALPPLPTP